MDITTGGADAALDARLSKELDAFNLKATEGHEQAEFTVRVNDADGELVAGLSGWTWGDCAGIEMVWVREDSRGGGWGARLLSAAETEARARGCRTVLVSSFTFQAPAFYARHGYAETTRVPGFPAGHEDVYFLKRL
ncbi:MULTISPECIES: GNAT family N-acetyltransferase [unclassified Streptomyces]|uniref:GNAT family N-acetyltransferase n=1 Tax=unclassified Streptomyces TaxID=2593676 RepID=UPI0022599EAE|nr:MULTISPECIES: GNAT family N-acetyltransferase [unclassified Streptomyces]MCX4526531.1 GNAT family N-acetyltransferase [Streptomyces sp. NBC_01551]MCX4542906.1 GNAT family N-acetyltransferase [Streptomyces sp. NBC_01565]